MEEEKKMMRLKMQWRENGEKDKNSVLKKINGLIAVSK